MSLPYYLQGKALLPDMWDGTHAERLAKAISKNRVIQFVSEVVKVCSFVSVRDSWFFDGEVPEESSFPYHVGVEVADIVCKPGAVFELNCYRQVIGFAPYTVLVLDVYVLKIQENGELLTLNFTRAGDVSYIETREKWRRSKAPPPLLERPFPLDYSLPSG